MKRILYGLLAVVPLFAGCANSKVKFEVVQTDGQKTTHITYYGNKDFLADGALSTPSGLRWKGDVSSSASGPIRAKGDAASQQIDAAGGIAGQAFLAGLQFGQAYLTARPPAPPPATLSQPEAPLPVEGEAP